MIKQKTFIALVFFLILLLPLGCGETNSSSRGSLSGKVTDSSGSPISGVTVYAAEKSAVTGVNGAYHLGDIKPAYISVSAQKDGYDSQSYSVEVYAGQERSGINFTLAKRGNVYNVSANNITSTGATIYFSTKNPAGSYVQYGLSSLYGATRTGSATNAISHQVALASLTPSTTYHYMVVANDSTGQTIRSDDFTFTTLITRRGTPPRNLKATNFSNTVLLTWDEDTEADFQGYKVYRADSKNGNFKPLSTAPTYYNQYYDSAITPGRKAFYAVSRLSGTGDETALSETAEILLPGQTKENIVWTPEQGTFILTADLVIGESYNLAIHPGVTVQVASQDVTNLGNDKNRVEIMVKGSLYIEATASNPVSITSANPAPKAGDWAGISFESTSNKTVSTISGLQLSFAKNGLKGTKGMPDVSYSRITNCENSGITFKDSILDCNILNNVFEFCPTGVAVASCTSNKIRIERNIFEFCKKAIVSYDNRDSQIKFNKVRSWTDSGIDIRNGKISTLERNVLAPCGAGTAIICRGYDEIRRNTLHGQTGIKIAGEARTRILSNLILADKARVGVGISYDGDQNYSISSHTIASNVIWSQDIPEFQHRDKSGVAIDPPITSLVKDPALEGGDPFQNPSSGFNYTPKSSSPLKGLGYGGEDIGAFDVP